ncbi:MAG: hypothetical protein ACFFD8_04280 [Candidatus Thorarchaeota archaeon]
MKIILTHDADSIHQPIEHILARRNRFTEKDLKAAEKGTLNLYNNIQEIIHLEAELGFHSTFFIPTFLFNLFSIIDTLKAIQRDGTELQLHYVHEDHPQFKGLFEIQKKFFGNLIGPVEGIRCHNLWITEPLLALFQNEAIYYDSSYRSETVGRVEPYAIQKGFIEIPISIMDADLFGRLQLTENEAWKHILNELKLAEDHRYQYFTLLFHQESFRMKGGRLYARLLKHLADEGYECLRCCDVPLVQQTIP